MQNTLIPPQSSTQEPGKRQLIQQQLVLLLHAHRCMQRDNEPANGQRERCKLPHCGTMKSVLNHMTVCQEDNNCAFAHCASSRQIIHHWKTCTREDCPVCSPLKRVAGYKRVGATQKGCGWDIFFSQSPQGESALSAVQDAVRGLPPPEGASIEKEWHKQVTSDLRNYLVSRLVMATFPSPDPAAIHRQRIKDMILYAQDFEKDMFELANNMEEYYNFLAEKIYEIQKDLGMA